VDEVGRGPLAGPVVAAAVIVGEGVLLEGVKDSKRMTPGAREQAFARIIADATAVGVGVVSAQEIDRINILQGSLQAMKRAVEALAPIPDLCLVDGLHRIPMEVAQWCVVKGDQRSRSISAASVVAKVYRDRLMDAYHRLYPVYGFDRNRGYGTRAHREALRKYGPCPIHRITFRSVR